MRAVEFAVVVIVAVNRHILPIAAECQARQIQLDHLIAVLHSECRRRVGEIQRIGSKIEIDSAVAEIDERRIVERSHAAERNDIAVIAVVIIDRISALPRRVQEQIRAIAAVNLICARAAVNRRVAHAQRNHVRVAVADNLQIVGAIGCIDRDY